MPSNISTFIIIIINNKINIIYMNILFFKCEHSIFFKQNRYTMTMKEIWLQHFTPESNMLSTEQTAPDK